MTNSERNSTRLPGPSPRSVVEVSDPTFGPIGFVVIDRPVRGAASGGVRFAPDVSPAELSDLARAMTYKWALLNVPMGGAKAGVFADPRRLGCDRSTLMEAFGRGLAPLVARGEYLPGVDLGTTLDDLRAIMRGAGRPLPQQQIDGSACTALTVFESIRQAARFRGMALASLRVAIEGFGKVGGVLARLLDEAGARLVAVSTLDGAIAADDALDVPQLLALQREHGDACVRHYRPARAIPPQTIFTQKVDLVVPGARPYVINAANAPQVQARLIVPIANAPITPDAEQALLDRGVVMLPDFVANCGGILASAMLSAGFDLDDARGLVETTLAQVIIGLLERARRERRPLSDMARRVAWHNHCALNEPAPLPAPLPIRMIRSIGAIGLDGVLQRLAWRAHQRWPEQRGAIRRMAAARFADQTLGATLAQVRNGRGPRPARGNA